MDHGRKEEARSIAQRAADTAHYAREVSRRLISASLDLEEVRHALRCQAGRSPGREEARVWREAADEVESVLEAHGAFDRLVRRCEDFVEEPAGRIALEASARRSDERARQEEAQARRYRVQLEEQEREEAVRKRLDAALEEVFGEDVFSEGALLAFQARIVEAFARRGLEAQGKLEAQAPARPRRPPHP